MRTKCTRWIVSAGVLLAAGAAAWAQDGGAVELDRRYIDTLNGFSLRPPAEVERKREFSASRIVYWQKRDPKTNAIAWTLSVLRAAESNENIDLAPYSKALAEKLQKNNDYKISSTELGKVGDKPAILFAGVTGGSIQWWQRQSWVLVEPGRFLVFAMAGPEDSKANLDKIYSEVLGTVQFSDPKEIKAQREKNLGRGQELLAGLTRERIAAALVTGPQWFLMRMKDKDVGFMSQNEAMVSNKGDDGFEITVWVMLEIPKDQPRLMKQVLFATPNGLLERWKQQLQVGSGNQSQVVAEDGSRINEMVVCNIQHDDKIDTRKKVVPKIPLPPNMSKDVYLPRAIGFLLPRLVDLSKAGSYGFAVYTSEANDFDLRTFTVYGLEKATLAGKEVQAFRATDQVAADAEPATLWLDDKGRLLQMSTPDGLVVQPATKAQVTAAFPNAEAVIKGMQQWANQP